MARSTDTPIQRHQLRVTASAIAVDTNDGIAPYTITLAGIKAIEIDQRQSDEIWGSIIHRVITFCVISHPLAWAPAVCLPPARLSFSGAQASFLFFGVLMKAAIVQAFDRPPVYGDIAVPAARPGETLVTMQAAALSQLVRAQAAGKHYSSGKTLPFVPGADGVGSLADGQRVYFAFPRPPIGAMAETVAVKTTQCVPLPATLDDITAAAMANPGMSSWAALEARAHFKHGETVLINGAAGASGRLAIQIAKYLGASRVVATARNPAVAEELHALGADAFITLKQETDALTAAFRREISETGVDVVLDYLGGAPAECFINAVAGHGSGEAARRIRFVNIGSLAGAHFSVAAGVLRSSGLEIMGSGLGSVSNDHLVQIIGKLLNAASSANFRITTKAIPLRDVEAAWQYPATERIVFTRD